VSDGLVIVGGGLAAQRCAETLRSRGFAAPVTIVCGEPERPYDRPPLSKGLLSGEIEEDAVRYREPGWYEDNAIRLLFGRRAVGLDPAARRVELDDGSGLDYERLLIATGSSPRKLGALERFSNVLALRTIADLRSLRDELGAGARLVVVGAGFIGQELAATARGLGVEVTIVEMLSAPLVGLLGERLGAWFAELHRSAGVDVRLGSSVVAGHGNGRVEELELDCGERLEVDAVVVGIGVAPATGWLAGSGLDADGIATDSGGRTAIPGIYAAGDVSRTFDPRVGAHLRGEHWDGASREGVAVARAILGDEPGLPPLPSFWSDQYGVRIQYVGYAAGADRAEIDGNLADRDFAVTYSRDGRPVAALAVGRPRQLIALRRLIESSHEEPNERTTDDLPTGN
jgi:NADPH-dependent 2,4-dienoyl-CoA reductase/sulfur reductase-like enzyme